MATRIIIWEEVEGDKHRHIHKLWDFTTMYRTDGKFTIEVERALKECIDTCSFPQFSMGTQLGV